MKRYAPEDLLETIPTQLKKNATKINECYLSSSSSSVSSDEIINKISFVSFRAGIIIIYILCAFFFRN
jgi:thiamine pyrophosphokinase